MDQSNQICMGYQICDSSVIHLADKMRDEMQIFIKTIDDKILTFEMKHSNKIRDLKMKIEEKTKLSADQQNLFYQGEILNDDDKTIDEYQICDQSVIDIISRLRGGMQIFVRTLDGNKIAIEVLRSEKIIDIKRKVQEKIGLNPDEQKLVFQGGTLDDDDKTVDEYEITEKCMINVVARLRGGMQVFDKSTKFEEKKQGKLSDLKYKIQNKAELDWDNQEVVYQGEILNDTDKKIDEYQICDQSVIDIFAQAH